MKSKNETKSKNRSKISIICISVKLSNLHKQSRTSGDTNKRVEEGGGGDGQFITHRVERKHAHPSAFESVINATRVITGAKYIIHHVEYKTQTVRMRLLTSPNWFRFYLLIYIYIYIYIYSYIYI